MSVQRPNLAKATCFALSLTGAAAVLATATMPDFAYAKNSKSNSASSNSQVGGSKSSKSQGGGSNSSKSSSSGSKNSKSKNGASRSSKPNDSVVRTSKSKKSKVDKSVRQTKPTGSKKIKTKKIIGGVHPSALGALNAAHASEQALLHASPNSRVGRIATYRDLVVDGKPLFDDLEDAQTALEGIDARVDEDGNVIPPEAIYVERNDATTELVNGTPQQEVFEGLYNDLQDALLYEDEDADAITAARLALDDYYTGLGGENVAIGDLNDDLASAVKYEAKYEELDVDNLQKLVEDQKLLETKAIQDAANKPVTEEIEYAVKEMLGLNRE